MAASRALGRRPLKRRKALEASSSCGYVLDVATPDGDLSLGPLLSTGSAPAVALECTLRAPCVVVDRSSGWSSARLRFTGPVMDSGEALVDATPS